MRDEIICNRCRNKIPWRDVITFLTIKKLYDLQSLSCRLWATNSSVDWIASVECELVMDCSLNSGQSPAIWDSDQKPTT